MLKAIIFDWHGVLDNTKLEDLLKKCAEESGLSFDEVKELLLESAREYALGNIPENEFWLTVAAALHLSTTQSDMLRNYINSIEWNKELWEFLPNLKKDYSLILLSDCPLNKAQLIRSDKRLEIFDALFFSAEMHLDKRTKEFFYLASNSLSLKPEECLFVDDSEKNVMFAQSLGFEAYKFTKTDDFINSFNHRALV